MERSVLEKLDCPFVVKLHQACQTKEKLFFVMEFAEGGTHNQRLLNLPNDFIR